jgi:hypothetical protein
LTFLRRLLGKFFSREGIAEYRTGNVEGPCRKLATKSREKAKNSVATRPPGIGKSQNAGRRGARLPVLFCDFSWQSPAYHPSKFDIPCSAFFCAEAK